MSPSSSSTFKSSLLLFLVIAVALAESNNNNNGTCDLVRRKTLGSFLKAEKLRAFSNAMAVSFDIKRNFQKLALLPLYHEDNGRFSQFFTVNGNFTANEAFDACQKLDGASLAVLNTEERLGFVTKSLVLGNYWIGLGRFDMCPVFTWLNGKRLGVSRHWHDNEPKAAKTGANCVRTIPPKNPACNHTFCEPLSLPTWMSDSCDSADGYSALCETSYPRPIYAYLPGRFDWKSAAKACQTAFNGNSFVYGANLAMPKTQSAVNSLVNYLNFNYRNWHCWIGLERFYEDNIWKGRWIDGTRTTRFSYLPMASNSSSSSTSSNTCAELYDADYSTSLSLLNQPYFNYNDCSVKLDCAICESFWQF